jgi:hypothetical protein
MACSRRARSSGLASCRGLPDSVAHACGRSSPRRERSEPRIGTGERPPPRDKTGPIIPAGLPVSATALAPSVDGADVPMPNVLSASHLDRIAGGLLYAATSNVPWATLMATYLRRRRQGLRPVRRQARGARRRHRPRDRAQDPRRHPQSCARSAVHGRGRSSRACVRLIRQRAAGDVRPSPDVGHAFHAVAPPTTPSPAPVWPPVLHHAAPHSLRPPCARSA